MCSDFIFLCQKKKKKKKKVKKKKKTLEEHSSFVKILMPSTN
jgi:hypothetical protein